MARIPIGGWPLPRYASRPTHHRSARLFVLGNDIHLQGAQTKYQGMLFFVCQADTPAEVLAADNPDVFHKTWLDAAQTVFKGHLISTTPLELNGHIGQAYPWKCRIV